MSVTAETLELMKTAQAAASDSVSKNFVQPAGGPTTGLQAYNLEVPSKKLYPILTPLRNRIPRVGGGFATQANWKAITAINVGNMRAGVGEGKRGGQVQHSMKEYFAAFRGIGLEKSVTFEADYAAKGFEDVKALAVTQTLQALMVQEEMLLLGGNTSMALGKTPTPTLVAVSDNTASGIPGSLSVICVALGVQAYWDVAGANNGASGQEINIATAQVPGAITRTNADGTTDTFGGGSAEKSAAATLSVSASNRVDASVTPVRGAYAYAWFWGTAGAEVLGAVTTTATVSIKGAAKGSQNANTLTGDNSTSALEFDGLLTQIAKPDSGAYYFDNAGKAVTSDGAGGVSEIEAAFAAFYNKYRLSPQTMYVSAADLVGITKLIIGNGGAPLLRLNVDVNQTTAIQAGVKVGSYLNKVTGDMLDVVVHPNLPQGTILFYSDNVPAYLDGVSQLLRVLARQDYYQIEWPLRTRRYEYGVYADEVLQGYFMPAFGMITNVKLT